MSALAGVAPQALAAGIVALVGLCVVWQRPLLACVIVFVMAEELPGDAKFTAAAPTILRLGTRFYEPIGPASPAILFGVVIATVAVVRALVAGRRIAVPVVPTCLAAALSTCALAVWIVGDPEVASVRGVLRAITYCGEPLLVLAGILLARAVPAATARKDVVLGVGAGLVAKGLLGAVVLLRTGGVTVDDQQHLLYYDAALPAVAGAALLGALLAHGGAPTFGAWCRSRRVGGTPHVVVIGAAAFVLLFSFRRAIWLMAVVGVVAGTVAVAQRVVLRRLVVLGGLAIVLVGVVPPAARAQVAGRVERAAQVITTGARTDTSAEGHVGDLRVGLAILKDHPVDGVGPRAKQPRELAARSTDFYIHNDVLNYWLRFGIVAGLLLVALFVSIAWHGIRALRAPSLHVVDAGAAAFLAVVAVPCMTAAFVTSSTRWPMIVGIAVGLVHRPSASRPSTSAPATALEATAQADPDPGPDPAPGEPAVAGAGAALVGAAV